MKRCAFLTMDNMQGFVSDDDLAVAPLAELGWEVDFISWHQTAVPWSSFDAVLMRSTWDYQKDPHKFLSVLAQIDQATRLQNDIGLARWNMHKSYLGDLRRRGVPIVPTVWGHSLTGAKLRELAVPLQSRELVFKPVIGANADDAVRIAVDGGRVKLAEAVQTYAQRPFMAQPFMPSILAEGEYSLFYFAGRYSHAILKKPGAGDFRVQEEHGGLIASVVPPPRLLRRAQAVVAVIHPPALYARVDLVRAGDDDFVVMELELIEPALYLRMDSGAPYRFAAAIDAWMDQKGGA
jgi:glutathione synthase/RimK-type ligase-like ATP-grasp enzyme